jgi:hypothetical protein
MKLRSRFAPGYEVWGRLNPYGPLVALAVGASGRRLRHAAVPELCGSSGRAAAWSSPTSTS